jgi:hypothetical protein
MPKFDSHEQIEGQALCTFQQLLRLPLNRQTYRWHLWMRYCSEIPYSKKRMFSSRSRMRWERACNLKMLRCYHFHRFAIFERNSSYLCLGSASNGLGVVMLVNSLTCTQRSAHICFPVDLSVKLSDYAKLSCHHNMRRAKVRELQ